MKVLYITNMYPVSDFIYFGIHVKEQIESVELTSDVKSEIYFINGRKSVYNYIKSIYKINYLIGRNKYDIVHVHFGLSGLFSLFSLFQNPPIILTIHGSDISKQKFGIMSFVTKLVARRAKNVIVMNDKMTLILNKYRSKVLKLPCGVDTNRFKETFVKKNSEKIIIGFPGDKKRKEKNFRLFLEIIRKIKKFDKIEIIEFHNMTRDQVVQNLNKIDLLLMTSISEGSPQIIKEAMACNKPIVSTNVGDVKDLLDGVQNSDVINSFDSESFLEPIMKLLNQDASKRYSDGREKLIKMGLDSKSISAKLYTIYKKLM